MSVRKVINVGIIGCSSIAQRKFIPALLKSKHANLFIVGSRDIKKAKLIADKNYCINYGAYDDVIYNPSVDLIYLSIPVTLRFDIAKKVIVNNKHLICEKPAFLNYVQAKEIVRLAKNKKKYVLDGWSYKYHDQYSYTLDIIRKNIIGDVRNISGVCSYPLPDSKNIRLRAELGGGVFYDSIGYPVSAAQLFIGKNPKSIYCTIRKNHKYKVDDYVSLQLQYENNISVSVFASLGCQYDTNIKVYGTKGSIELTKAFAMKSSDVSKIITNCGFEVEEIKFKPQDLFLRMIDNICKHIIDKTELKLYDTKSMLNYHLIMDYATESNKKKNCVDNLKFK